MAFGNYDNFANRIERWPGATIRERLNTGRDGHIIDFELEFPDGAFADPEPARVGAVEASAIIFESPLTVDEWQLRLPQIPTDGRGRGNMAHDIKQAISQPNAGDFIVTPADGNRSSYTPHIDAPNYTPVNTDPMSEIQLLRDIWDDYREWAASEFDRLEGQ